MSGDAVKFIQLQPNCDTFAEQTLTNSSRAENVYSREPSVDFWVRLTSRIPIIFIRTESRKMQSKKLSLESRGDVQQDPAIIERD